MAPGELVENTVTPFVKTFSISYFTAFANSPSVEAWLIKTTNKDDWFLHLLISHSLPMLSLPNESVLQSPTARPCPWPN